MCNSGVGLGLASVNVSGMNKAVTLRGNSCAFGLSGCNALLNCDGAFASAAANLAFGGGFGNDAALITANNACAFRIGAGAGTLIIGCSGGLPGRCLVNSLGAVLSPMGNGAVTINSACLTTNACGFGLSTSGIICNCKEMVGGAAGKSSLSLGDGCSDCLALGTANNACAFALGAGAGGLIMNCIPTGSRGTSSIRMSNSVGLMLSSGNNRDGITINGMGLNRNACSFGVCDCNATCAVNRGVISDNTGGLGDSCASGMALVTSNNACAFDFSGAAKTLGMAGGWSLVVV